MSPDAPYLTKIVFHIAPGVELSCSMGVLPVFITLISAEPSLISGHDLATSRRLSEESNEVIQDHSKHNCHGKSESARMSPMSHTLSLHFRRSQVALAVNLYTPFIWHIHFTLMRINSHNYIYNLRISICKHRHLCVMCDFIYG